MLVPVQVNGFPLVQFANLPPLGGLCDLATLSFPISMGITPVYLHPVHPDIKPNLNWYGCPTQFMGFPPSLIYYNLATSLFLITIILILSWCFSRGQQWKYPLNFLFSHCGSPLFSDRLVV